MPPTPPVHPRRLVYMGTPAMAVPPLRALVGAGFDVALVVTRPDKRRGRGSDLSPSPVKQAAVDLGVPVTHDVDDAIGVGADLGVVVAYGRILRAPVLDRLPLVNLHFSLLPRWRGAAPVERAILAGDTVTGVCVMAVEPELDTGAVYARREVPIGAAQTADELRHALVVAGTDLLVDALESVDGLAHPVPQQGEPTYAAKIDPSELRIDWSRPSADVDRLVRVGGAHTTFRGARLKVWRIDPTGATGVPVSAGDGVVGLLEVQPEGRARMAAADWANGARPGPGDIGS